MEKLDFFIKKSATFQEETTNVTSNEGNCKDGFCSLPNAIPMAEPGFNEIPYTIDSLIVKLQELAKQYGGQTEVYGLEFSDDFEDGVEMFKVDPCPVSHPFDNSKTILIFD